MRGATVQMIALRDLQANPYRHIERYVISEEDLAVCLAGVKNAGVLLLQAQGDTA